MRKKKKKFSHQNQRPYLRSPTPKRHYPSVEQLTGAGLDADGIVRHQSPAGGDDPAP